MVPLLLLLTIGATKPVLCVEVEGGGLDRAELIAAIRARVPRSQLRVRRCALKRPATWRLLVLTESQQLRLALTGAGLAARKILPVGSMSTQELTQQVALTAAEAVRPAVEGPKPKTSELIAKIESRCQEPKPCPSVGVPLVKTTTVTVTSTVVAPARWALQLAAGLLIGTEDGSLGSYLELGTDVRWGSAVLSVRSAFSAGQQQAPLSLWEVELGLSIGWRWRFLQLGAGFVERLAIAQVQSDVPSVEDRLQLFFNGGLIAQLEARVWDVGGWELGIVSQAWFWPQPNRFLLQGQALLSQSYLEVFVGLRGRWFPVAKSF